MSKDEPSKASAAGSPVRPAFPKRSSSAAPGLRFATARALAERWTPIRPTLVARKEMSVPPLPCSFPSVAICSSHCVRTAAEMLFPSSAFRSDSEIGSSPPSARKDIRPKETIGLLGIPSPAGFQAALLKPRASAV